VRKLDGGLMIRKTSNAVVIAILAAGVFVSTAAAAKPVKSPVPFSDVTGQFCEDFPVLVQATTNKVFVITFDSGRVLSAGAFKLRLTNLETNEVINVNASGPVMFSSDGATVTLRGNSVLAGETGFFGPGSPPRLSLISGSVVIDLATGSVLSETGRSRDLCARLAA